MKHYLLIFGLLVSCLGSADSQVAPATQWSHNWPAATATGPVGQYLVLTGQQSGGPPPAFTIDTYVTGTVPSTCTFEVQGSPDGVVWSTGTASLSGDVSCASASLLTYSFYSKPIRYLRINIGTLTGADGTTNIMFFYTRAGNAR